MTETSSGTGSIIGKVVNRESGKKIKGASVSDGKRSVISDSFGEYSFEEVAPGKYTVICSFEGYATSIEAGVVVVSATNTTVDLYLSSSIGSIRARVKDKKGNALSGALVTLGTEPATSILSNDHWFLDLEPGTYFLKAVRDGYLPSPKKSVMVEAGKDTFFTISLRSLAVPEEIEEYYTPWERYKLLRLKYSLKSLVSKYIILPIQKGVQELKWPKRYKNYFRLKMGHYRL